MKKQCEKGVFRKLIEVYWEQVQRRKALRLLEKQDWSLDFLTALLVRASKHSSSPLTMTITAPNGAVIRMESSNVTVRTGIDDSDSIMDRLDDPIAVEQYVKRYER